ncbi:Protein TIC 62, chloroplastic [Quillaja saponaria]|uniref:Protein TIC 62, chloroplastic n=1 Tax=Quillaja saponaria TaxID=32244 RepID=A0AAD7PUK0_QUISA|nr:Protein TIC 62, chloroplastic [Quillaja saponaria]
MVGLGVQSLTVPTFPSYLSRRGFIEKPSGCIQLLRFPETKRCPNPTKLKFSSVTAQASGKIESRANAVEGIPAKVDLKDDNVVFVAGATGKVGSRTVRELLKLGLQVRAGVRNAQKADTLVQSIKQMKLDVRNASEGSTSVEMLEIVECDLEKPDQIPLALGNASIVICCIGASEKEVFDITGPYRIDYAATKNLIDAATVADVNHFILLTSLGTNKIGFPAAILNLFWGVLIWKRKAEEALLASGLPYTIVRPGGMERPTDAYKETHNITLSKEDTLFGGQVSNLQVAELLAFMAKSRALSYCKVVEVIAETTAPLAPIEELLSTIPSQRDYVDSSKEPDDEAVLDSVSSPSDNVLPVEPSTASEQEPSLPKAVAKQPLSPYTVYDGLKPPSSPSPAQSGGRKEVDIIDAVSKPSASGPQSGPSGITGVSQAKSEPEQLAAGPLSPYVAYEDLKPPSSPSPTPSGSKEKPLSATKTVEYASPSTAGNVAEKTVPTSIDGKDPPQNTKHYHSPYYVYTDFKPPTSPSPNVPTTSLSTPAGVVDGGSNIASLSGNGTAQVPVADEPNDGRNHTELKPTPNSPFIMYDDLKPPASPTPSSRKS